MSIVDKIKQAFDTEYVPEAFVKKVREAYVHSPDAASILMYQHQNIFICDEYMSHMPYAGLLQNEERLSTAFTEAKYSMWKKKLGMESFPIVMETFSHICPPAKIKGELYNISSSLLVNVLDKLKSNGIEFQRKRIGVYVPYRNIHWLKDKSRYEEITGVPMQSSKVMGDEQLQRITAWCYFGCKDYWEDGKYQGKLTDVDTLDGGYNFAPVKRFSRSGDLLEQYYFFSIKELDVETNQE